MKARRRVLDAHDSTPTIRTNLPCRRGRAAGASQCRDARTPRTDPSPISIDVVNDERIRPDGSFPDPSWRALVPLLAIRGHQLLKQGTTGAGALRCECARSRRARSPHSPASCITSRRILHTPSVTTRASYRRRVRRERFEWPPEDCIPGSPWTGGSLRFGNRLRRTFGCGSTRRLSA